MSFDDASVTTDEVNDGFELAHHKKLKSKNVKDIVVSNSHTLDIHDLLPGDSSCKDECVFPACPVDKNNVEEESRCLNENDALGFGKNSPTADDAEHGGNGSDCHWFIKCGNIIKLRPPTICQENRKNKAMGIDKKDGPSNNYAELAAFGAFDGNYVPNCFVGNRAKPPASPLKQEGKGDAESEFSDYTIEDVDDERYWPK